MNAIVPVSSRGEIMETVLLKGNLSDLTAEERSEYYLRFCESVGLNPLTRPLEYITLNNKLTLYARKDCTDQLRSIHKVSVEELLESERDGVFIITAKVRNAEGRTDAAKGAVSILGLKGEGLANAIMKAETKAKRRATLSICGLGLLDESEIDSIPQSARATPATVTTTVPGAPKEEPPDPQEARLKFIRDTHAIIDGWDTEKSGGITAWWNSEEQKALRRLHALSQDDVDIFVRAIKLKRAAPAAAKPAVPPAPDEVKKADLSADLSDDDEMPDPSKDYPGFVNYLANRVHSFKGQPFEEAETWFQDNIMTMPSGTLMPPDLAMLRGEKERLRSR